MKQLFFWPNLTRFNPYQQILYAELDSYTLSDQLPWQAGVQSGANSATFHLHWEHWIYKGLKTEDEVELAIHGFLSRVVQFIHHGGCFLWTVHNEQPHENLWPKQHAALQESLASLSHVILVHNITGKNDYSERFPNFAHKIFVVRHPSYRDYLNKIEASPIDGLHRVKDKTFLFFGQIRKYKGLDFVLSCLSQSALQSKPWRLIIAGEGPIEEYVNRFYTGEKRRLVVVNRRVSDAEVKYLAGVADVGLFAFQKILASGSVQMLADLGLSLVAPAFPSLQEEPDLNKVHWYAPGEAASFMDALSGEVSNQAKAVTRTPSKGDGPEIPREAGHSSSVRLHEALEHVKPATSVVKRATLEADFGGVILCWPGLESTAHETQRKIAEAGLPCHVVYSESRGKPAAASIPSDWIKIPDDWYYGKKLQFVLEFFKYDTLLQIQADATFNDWHLVVQRLRSAFGTPRPYRLGVWAPDIDYTFWKSPAVDVGRDASAGLRFVMQTDTTCWALSGDVQKFLRTTPLALNNTGWGIDWAAIAFSYATGRSVCRDETIKISHPQGSNYARGDAEHLQTRYISALPVALRVQFQILNEFSRMRLSTHLAKEPLNNGSI